MVDAPEPPIISIVIPTFRRHEDLLRLLSSILESSYPNQKIENIVIDNANEKELQSILSKNFPSVLVVAPNHNLYSNGARKRGAELAHGKYIFFLDDDNVLEKNCLLHLVTSLEQNENLGMVGPLMLEGSKKYIWCAGAKITNFGSVTRILKDKNIDNLNLPKLIYGIDYFPNACMVRANVLKQAPLDDKVFPHNWAESDFGLRVKQAGYGIACVTAAIDRHYIGYTGMLTRVSADKTYDQAKSRILFRRRHMSKLSDWLKFWLLVFPISSLAYTRAIMHVPKDKFIILRSYIKGTIDGLLYPHKNIMSVPRSS